MVLAPLRRSPARTSLLSAALLTALAACDGANTSPGAAVPRSLALVTPPPGEAIAGTPLAPQPVIELRAADGEPVRLAGVTIEASVSLGTLSGATSVATDAQGRAAFTDLVLTGEAGPAELRFSCCDLQPVTRTVALSLGSVNVMSPRSAPSAQSRAGTVMVPGPSVSVSDGQSAPVEGALVRFTLADPGGPSVASIATNAEGIAELPSFGFSEIPGTTVLIATLDGTQQQARFELHATVSGQVQVVDQGFVYAGAVGQEFTLPTILVTEGGIPQPGVEVRFRNLSIASAAVTGVTDAAGKTGVVTLPLSQVGGENAMDVFAVGYSSAPAGFRVLGAEHLPLRLSSDAPANVVTLEDEYGRTFLSVWVVNAVGAPVRSIHTYLSKEGEVGAVTWWDMFGPAGDAASYPTDEFGSTSLRWLVPATAGTYRIKVSSPYIAEPVTFTAIRGE